MDEYPGRSDSRNDRPVMPEDVFARILSRYAADGMPEDLDALTRHDSRLRENVDHLIEARDALIHFGGQWETRAEEYRTALERIEDVCVNESNAAIAATKAADIAIEALPSRGRFIDGGTVTGGWRADGTAYIDGEDA